jgi:hypothetical protein
MRAPSVIVLEILREDALEMTLAEHNDVVQALSPDAANQSFRVRILPWAPRGREHLFDAEASDPPSKRGAINTIPVSQEILRRFVPGKGLHDLLRRPLTRGVFGHIEVNDATAVVSEHHEDEQHGGLHRRDDEEVNRNQVLDVVSEKRLPRRRRWPAGPHPILLHGGLGHVDPEFS